MSNNVKFSDRFSIVKTAIDTANRNDWQGVLGCLSDDFVWEVVVFDGPNLSFSRKAFKDHFEGIPGFVKDLGESKVTESIEGEDKIFLHFTTSARFMAAIVPKELTYEFFLLLQVSGGKITKLQLHTDTKKVAELNVGA